MAPGRAEVRRPQGRAATAGDLLRRDPGLHRQPRPRGGRRRGGRAAGRWASAAGTSRPSGETLQLRVTKKGRTLLHVARREGGEVDRAHDREKPRRVALDAPFLRRLRVVDDEGRLVPSRRDKYHQVEALVGALAATWDDALAAGAVRRPTDGGAAARGGPGVRQRAADLRRAPPPDLAGASGAHHRRRPQGAGATAQRRRRGRPGVVDGLPGRLRRDRGARSAPGRGAGAARLRHRDRRRAGARAASGGPRWCWRPRAATTTCRRSCAT